MVGDYVAVKIKSKSKRTVYMAEVGINKVCITFNLACKIDQLTPLSSTKNHPIQKATPS